LLENNEVDLHMWQNTMKKIEAKEEQMSKTAKIIKGKQ
jgi:hypothetical protein